MRLGCVQENRTAVINHVLLYIWTEQLVVLFPSTTWTHHEMNTFSKFSQMSKSINDL